MANNIHDAVEKVKANEKGRLRTHDSFLWCEGLKAVVCPQLLQNELYMGLLYSALFILWNDTARPVGHVGRFPVAAMLVDGNNKPIAFSINTSKADNSIAHAETGMLLRYFNGTKAKNLPTGSKLYTTLESCEMCRAGLSLVKDSKSEFKELYGKKDDKVECPIYPDYSLSSHSPSTEYLKKINLKEDKKFYVFCRANYLALKSFLNDRELKSRFPELFENIQILWDRLIKMRVTPWVGNPVLYNLEDDSSNPNVWIIKEKPDFEELYKLYYGDDISQFRIKEKEFCSKGLTVMKGPISFGSKESIMDADVIAGNVKMGKNTSTMNVSVYAHHGIEMRDGSSIILNKPTLFRADKDRVKQQELHTGYPLDEKKLMGDYTSTFEDEKFKKILFVNVMSYANNSTERAAISTEHSSSLVDCASVTSASAHSRSPGIGLHSSPRVVGVMLKHVAISTKGLTA